MAIQIVPPWLQPVDKNGVPYAGSKLYIYQTDSSTPVTTYSDSDLTQLNAFPVVSDTDGVFGPMYVDLAVGELKLVLKDSLDNPLRTRDPLILNPFTATDIVQFVTPITDAEAEAGVTSVNFNYPEGDVRRYGADPTGATDSRAAMQTAINVARAGRGRVYIPGGAWLINSTTSADTVANGLLIPYSSANGTSSRLAIHTDGKATVLKAGNTGMVVLRCSDSRIVIGSMTIDGQSLTNVWGLGLIPESLTQTASVVNQIDCTVDPVFIINCTEGLVTQAGPRVSSVDSGSWYHEIEAYIYSCTRGVWFRDPPILASGTNAVTLRGRVGQNCNTGLQIDSGTGNKIYADFEGISAGTTPNTNPTAVIVQNQDAWGTSNDDNKFYGCREESNTVDLANSNASTDLIGGTWTESKCAVDVIASITNSTTAATVTMTSNHRLTSGMERVHSGTTPAAYSGRFIITVTGAKTYTYTMLSDPGGPATVVGRTYTRPRTAIGMDPSIFPLILPGLLYGEGIASYPSGAIGFTKPPYDDGYPWQDYTLTTSLVSNTASVASVQSKYKALGDFIFWSFNFKFNASVAATRIEITPPIAPAAIYTANFGLNPVVMLAAEDGSGTRKAVESGWTSGNKYYILTTSATWNTGGNNNAVGHTLVYHK